MSARIAAPTIEETAHNGHGIDRAAQRTSVSFLCLAARIRALCAVENPQSSAYRGRIAALDGLRGLAALAVVFHHSFIWPMLFSKGITSADSFHRAYGHNVLLSGLWYSYSGVELFFLLSGFCLFLPIFSQPDLAFNWRRYAINRFRRIYPPYLASLGLAIGLAAAAWSKIDFHLHYATEPVTLRSVATAITLTQSHFCLPFWSLVVEAQWYFVVPILALLWRKHPWAIHAGMFVIIAITTVLAQAGPEFHLGFLGLSGLAVYLPLFWIGIVLAQIATCRRNQARKLLAQGGWLIILLIGVATIYKLAPPPAVWTPTREQAYPFGIFYAGVLAAALFTPVGKRLFSCHWMVKAGAFSYSLYLVHALVVYVAIVFLDHYRITGRQELLLCLTVLPAICIGVGYVFYLAVEKQIQVKRSFRRLEVWTLKPVSVAQVLWAMHGAQQDPNETRSVLRGF